MSTPQFENNIKRWVSLDQQLKELGEKTKLLREQRTQLEQQITNYAQENRLTNSVVQISDGKLRFTNSRIPEPLTFKYLERTLREIIPNEETVNTVMRHLRDRRNVREILELKRYYSK